MWYPTAENRISQLDHDLCQARRVVVSLLPPTVREIAEEYYGISTYREAIGWLKKIVEAATDIAWPYAEETRYSGPRAYCPLCHGGTHSYLGEEGFLLPGGMHKHLLGEGNAHECEVMVQVRELAATYWRPRAEEARRNEEAELARRRTVEDQFRLGPSDTPKLIDELYSTTGGRDEASLSWAIDRLAQLGFKETREGLLRQFTKEYERIVVYADPRESGRIEFAVYRREQVEKPKSRKRWSPDHDRFHLLDAWRNDLVKKFEQRVEGAIRSSS